MASEYTSSLVLIVPDALKAEANRLMAALGRDVLPGDTFTVPASASGNEPATHWACRTVDLPAFKNMMNDAKASGNPPGKAYADFDLTIGQVKQVFDALFIHSIAQDSMSPVDHFNAALAEAGLVWIQGDGP